MLNRKWKFNSSDNIPGQCMFLDIARIKGRIDKMLIPFELTLYKIMREWLLWSTGCRKDNF